eukprot:m.56516 g.56516  ORF g.56516 m.56516 type:complete len:66 (-) comp15583_c0_seq3:2059-2256(-)
MRGVGMYVVRGFQVRDVRTAEVRVVWQLHFTGWPDHGVPSSSSKFLAFIDEIRTVRTRLATVSAL